MEWLQLTCSGLCTLYRVVQPCMHPVIQASMARVPQRSCLSGRHACKAQAAHTCLLPPPASAESDRVEASWSGMLSSQALMSTGRDPTFTVHCHQQYSWPCGPLRLVLTQGRCVSAGSFTYTLRGSMDTTTACAPYACHFLRSATFVPTSPWQLDNGWDQGIRRAHVRRQGCRAVCAAPGFLRLPQPAWKVAALALATHTNVMTVRLTMRTCCPPAQHAA